jgi:hypothetical protein
MQQQHAELAVRCKTQGSTSIHQFILASGRWSRVEADAQPAGVSTAQPTRYSTVDLLTCINSGIRMQIQGAIFLVLFVDESKGHETIQSTRSPSKQTDQNTRTAVHGALPSTAVAAVWKQQGARHWLRMAPSPAANRSGGVTFDEAPDSRTRAPPVPAQPAKPSDQPAPRATDTADGSCGVAGFVL